MSVHYSRGSILLATVPDRLTAQTELTIPPYDGDVGQRFPMRLPWAIRVRLSFYTRQTGTSVDGLYVYMHYADARVDDTMQE